MTVDFKNIPKISKTNMLGVLEFASAIIIAVVALPPKPAWTLVAIRLLTTAIRFLQTDADRLSADSPGNPTSQPVDAHPVPNDLLTPKL